MGFFAQNEVFGNFVNGVAMKIGISPTAILLILLIILIWSAVWKLLAMWKAAKKDSWIWFVAFALLNTVGILPILYIYVLSEVDWSKYIKFQVKKPKFRKKR